MTPEQAAQIRARQIVNAVLAARTTIEADNIVVEALRTHTALVTALREYGQHKDDCEKWGDLKPVEARLCTCGFDQVLTGQAEAPRSEEG